MSILDDFKARFPEFNSEQVNTYIPILERVYSSYYRGEYNSASKELILNLLAHLLVGETAHGVAQQKSSVSVGNVSTSYVVSSTQTDRALFFNSSKYGQRFWMMLQNSSVSVAFV